MPRCCKTRQGAVALACGIWLVTASPARGDVLYVKAQATGPNDGTSWADAYTDLQDALTTGRAGDEIWVAAGIYRPSERTAPEDPFSVTFRLKSGVEIYGGFAGTETDRGQRDPATNVTILSGDLAGDDAEVLDPAFLLGEPTRADNCYHVVTGSSADETAVLDGFTITAGMANGENVNDVNGGGMFNVVTGGVLRRGIPFTPRSPARPTLINCTFSGNAALGHGGGLYNRGGILILTNCVFRGNSADGIFPVSIGRADAAGGGGGLYSAGRVSGTTLANSHRHG